MKKRKLIIGIVCFLLIIVCGGVIIFLYQPTKTVSERDQIKETYQEIYNSSNSDASNEIETNAETEMDIITKYQQAFNNTDIIAELTLTNTDVTVPVAKTTDNEYYLDHLLNKKKNVLGSVFMDYRNNPIDRKILIYGHNSQTLDTEFHILESYLNPDFIKNHSTMKLRTKDNVYEYKIFAVIIVTTDYQHMKLNFTSEEYATHLNWLKENSVYDTGVEVSKTDQILILQTCYYEPDDSYLLVVGKKL